MPSAPLCIFFSRGNCRNGVSCPFSHSAPIPQPNPAPRAICSFFLRGKCTRGESCRFLHPNCRVMQLDGTWTSYVPSPKSVLVLAAGFNGNIERLRELGFDEITTLYSPDYDRYPASFSGGSGPPYLGRPLRPSSAFLEASPPLDHSSFADDVALPAILDLVSRGLGPSLVVAGSRGGQVTICRLWEFWHGPSVVLNGGCGVETAPPGGVPLGLLTQGRDFFPSCSVAHSLGVFSEWPGAVALFHDDEDDHSVKRSYNYAIGLVISMVLQVPKTREEAMHRIRTCLSGPVPGGHVLLKPRGVGAKFDALL